MTQQSLNAESGTSGASRGKVPWFQVLHHVNRRLEERQGKEAAAKEAAGTSHVPWYKLKGVAKTEKAVVPTCVLPNYSIEESTSHRLPWYQLRRAPSIELEERMLQHEGMAGRVDISGAERLRQDVHIAAAKRISKLLRVFSVGLKHCFLWWVGEARERAEERGYQEVTEEVQREQASLEEGSPHHSPLADMGRELLGTTAGGMSAAPHGIHTPTEEGTTTDAAPLPWYKRVIGTHQAWKKSEESKPNPDDTASSSSGGGGGEAKRAGDLDLGGFVPWYKLAAQIKEEREQAADVSETEWPTEAYAVLLQGVVQAWWFDAFINLCVILSCVFLAMDDSTVVYGSSTHTVLEVGNLALSLIFTVEATMKVLGLGWTFYLKSPWNRLDFFIVIVSLIALPLQNTGIAGVKGFRAARSLRPLRLISHNKNLQLIINTIGEVLGAVWITVVCTVMVWAFFSVLGVHLFAGCFGACNDATLDLTECRGSYRVDGREMERVWGVPFYNFDNLGNAFLTLFAMSSLDAWHVSMYRGIDCTGPGLAPVRDYNMSASIFYVFFVLLGSLLVLNLIVGQVVNLYNELTKAGMSLMTQGQQQWMLAMRMQLEEKEEEGDVELLEDLPPIVPDNGVIVRWCHAAVGHWIFEAVIMITILCNTATLMATYHHMPIGMFEMFEVANHVFFGIFIWEAVMKFVAYGLLEYFLVGWNQFDFLCLTCAVLGYLVEDMGSANTAFRTMRLLRIFKLVRRLKGLKSLLITVFLSVASLANVGIILALFVFIWAVCGMSIIGELPDGVVVNQNFNFGRIGPAMSAMFRVLTMDGWVGIIEDCSSSGAACQATTGKCGVPTWLSGLFFSSFIFLTAFVVLNIFIAVMLVNFQDTALGDGLMEVEALMSVTHKQVQCRKLVSNFKALLFKSRTDDEPPSQEHAAGSASVAPAETDAAEGSPVAAKRPLVAVGRQPAARDVLAGAGTG